VCSAVSYEAKVLGGCDCEEGVVVGTEGEGIGVEGEGQEGVWHGNGNVRLPDVELWRGLADLEEHVK